MIGNQRATVNILILSGPTIDHVENALGSFFVFFCIVELTNSQVEPIGSSPEAAPKKKKIIRAHGRADDERI